VCTIEQNECQMPNPNNILNALTYGLGSELGKAVRVEYYKSLDRLKQFIASFKLDQRKIDLIEDMIALACFRDIVLFPVEGSIGFIRRINSFDVHGVKMGTYTLDKNYIKDIDGAVRHFYAILSEFSIDPDFLDLADIKLFAVSVLKMIEAWEE